MSEKEENKEITGAAEKAIIIHSLPPVVGHEPRVLILGSMPSPTSLKRREYYANPRNQFWKLIAGVLREELPASYEGKIEVLKKHKIALWDSIATCERDGALDKNIKNPTSNDMDAFLEEKPTITSICFNGVKSQEIFFRGSTKREGIEYPLLPSSSPARAMKFDDKLKEWRELLDTFLW